MTTSSTPRARAPFPTLLGLALVLLTMAVVLTFIWLNGSSNPSVCMSSDSGTDCLLSMQLDEMRADLLGGAAVASFVSSGVALMIGLVQLIWDRRR